MKSKVSIKSKSNKMTNNDELSNKLETEMRKLLNKARMEVLEVCSKEYNFDINAAMLLVGAGVERKVVKEPKAPKEKKPPAKAVKEQLDQNSDRKRNCKGRPKNPEKVVDVEETENLFEQLVSSQLEQTIEIDDAICVVFQTKEEMRAEKLAQGAEKAERGLMSGEEKATKAVNKAESKLESKLEASASAIAAKEQAKLAKDAEKLAKDAEKLAKDAEKLAAKEYKLLCQQKKAEEKLAAASAIAEEKLAKARAIAEEKLAKAQEKKASASSKKPTASSAIAAKMTDLSEKLEAVPVEVVAVMATASSKEPTASGIAASAPATLKVKSFKYEGATYFREKTTGAIYDKESNDHLGQWNEASQKIDFLEPEEELEEEDESAGESSDEEEEEEEEESA
jgi:hypothetical protein